MARVVSLTLFLLSWILLFSYAASRERNEDKPSINCQLCEKVTNQINQQVQKKKAQKLVVSVLEIIDNVCDHRKQEAHWIWQIDSVEKGAKLELLGIGKCNSECEAIERECKEVVEKFSDKEVNQFKNRPSDDKLAKRLCHDLFPDACPKDLKEENLRVLHQDLEVMGQYFLDVIGKPFKKAREGWRKAIKKDGKNSEL